MIKKENSKLNDNNYSYVQLEYDSNSNNLNYLSKIFFIFFHRF